MISVAARSFARTLMLLGAIASLGACAARDPDPTSSSARSAISGGQPDSVDSNVFALVSHRGAEGVALCSASLIAPNLLLTARHCVADVSSDVVTCGVTQAGTPFPAGTFYAANTETVAEATSAFRASSVSVPSQGVDICGFDLALVTLESAVPASMATPLVPRIDRPVLRGEPYSAVGYGQDSPGDAGIAGKRMDRTGMQVACAPGTCGIEAEASEFVGDTGICSGDSGGPALDSDGKVVGVVSRSADNCAHPIYGSVAAWKDWITGVAKLAAAQGKYPPPFWVTSGSSDPTVSAPDAGEAGAPASGASGGFGTQGDKCGSPADCASGFGCFSPTGSASNAYCASVCSAANSCSAGTHCAFGVDVCVADSVSRSDSTSCAVRAPGHASASLLAAWLGLGLLGLGYCRRSRSARR